MIIAQEIQPEKLEEQGFFRQGIEMEEKNLNVVAQLSK